MHADNIKVKGYSIKIQSRISSNRTADSTASKRLPLSAEAGRTHPEPVMDGCWLVIGLVPVIVDHVMCQVGRHIGGHQVQPLVVLQLLL